MENGDIVIGRSAKSIVSTHHGNPGSGAVVMGADAASYGARGDVAIGASAETNVKIKNDGGTVNPKYAQGVAIGSTAKTYGTQSLLLSVQIQELSVIHPLPSAVMISIWLVLELETTVIPIGCWKRY